MIVTYTTYYITHFWNSHDRHSDALTFHGVNYKYGFKPFNQFDLYYQLELFLANEILAIGNIIVQKFKLLSTKKVNILIWFS